MVDDLGVFADTIFKQKYAQRKSDGSLETWPECAHRVVGNVMAPYAPRKANAMEGLVRQRKVMPGGRYLYCAGRPYPQIGNCFLFSAEDSRDGWAALMRKVTSSLMTGGGVGVVYSKVRPAGSLVGGMGGASSGPISLMEMINEVGRRVRQGGSRRCLPGSTLVTMANKTKKRIDEVKVGDTVLTRFGPKAVTHFFDQGVQRLVRIETQNGTVRSSPYHRWLSTTYNKAKTFHVPASRLTLESKLYKFGKRPDRKKKRKNYEIPSRILAISWDVEEPTYDIEVEEVHEFIADDFVSHNSAIWSGLHWDHADIRAYINLKNWPAWVVEQKAKDFNTAAPMDGTNISVILDDEFFRAYKDNIHGHHTFAQRVYWDVVHSMCKTGEPGFSIDVGENAGEHLRNACVPAGTNVLTDEGEYAIETLVGRDVRVWNGEAWAAVTPKLTGEKQYLVEVSLSNGAMLRCTKTHKFLVNCGTEQRPIEKRLDADALLPGDLLMPYALPGKAPQRFTVLSSRRCGFADRVYCFNEPISHRGTFDGIVTGQCTEVVSRNDSDVCNLASLNLARFQSLDEFVEAIRHSIGFLLCGTIYGVVPLEETWQVRDVNRRLGLGLMGMHEWLLKRGIPYGPDPTLAHWLEVYQEESHKSAKWWAKKLGTNVPIATRAIAPTGTISILAETTSGIEPLFATAYKRRYLKGDVWHAQYVIDAAAQRVIDAGVDPNIIEDAYDLSADVGRRLAFQAFVQKYVDQGISSTINLPAWGTSHNNETNVKIFGETLMEYLPQLRGITTYPDGSRGGQPLNKVSYREAASRTGVEFAENGNENACVGGSCGA